MNDHHAPAPQAGQAQGAVEIHPNNEFTHYMQLNANFMNNISTQLEINDIISKIPTFSGQNAANYRAWRKQLLSAASEHDPVDDALMRKLVSRTVTESASDFWQEIKRANPNITWAEIQTAFRDRFANFVDRQIALQKLTKLKQEKKQTLHSFANKIVEIAREAYDDADYATAIVTRQLRDIFIDGLKCHKTSQILIRDEVADLPAALNRAVRQDLLKQTYRLRQIDDDGRQIEDMDVDAIETDEKYNTAPATTKQIEDLAVEVAAIARNFKKAQGQMLKGQRESKNENRPQQSGFQNQKTNENFRAPPLMGLPQQYPNFAPQSSQHNSNPNSWQPYPQNYVHPPQFHNNGYKLAPPPLNRPPQQRKPVQWTNDGRPICLYCDRPGHMKRECWKLYPELKNDRPPRIYNKPQNNMGN